MASSIRRYESGLEHTQHVDVCAQSQSQFPGLCTYLLHLVVRRFVHPWFERLFMEQKRFLNDIQLTWEALNALNDTLWS